MLLDEVSTQGLHNCFIYAMRPTGLQNTKPNQASALDNQSQSHCDIYYCPLLITY
jgi:hypothetical protein